MMEAANTIISGFHIFVLKKITIAQVTRQVSFLLCGMLFLSKNVSFR